MSGDVTFSSGLKAQWHLDQFGRIGLVPEQEGAQPSQEEVQEFQMELQRQLQGGQM